MTITFVTETTGSRILGALDALAERFRAARIQWAERRAIAGLLEMDATRLADMGIDADDVRDALSASSPVGPQLEARRRARALSWTPARLPLPQSNQNVRANQ